jgi:hypothetical protein
VAAISRHNGIATTASLQRTVAAIPTTKPPWKVELPRAAAELVQLLGLCGEAFDEFGVVLSDGSFQSLEHAALTWWQLVVGHVGHLVVARAGSMSARSP